MTESTTAFPASQWDAYRALRLIVLLCGPFMTLAAARAATGAYGPSELASVETVVMLLWSPLFFSIPALLLQNHRDRALPTCSLLSRWARLLPYLLRNPQSQVRPETLIGLVTWVLLLALTWPSISAVALRFL